MMKQIFAFLVAVLLVGAPAWAQDVADADSDAATLDVGATGDADGAADTPAVADAFEDQAEWDDFTDRVETAIVAGRASNTVLGDLRSQLASWRDTFLSRQSLNASRIETVRAQLSALGDAPENGEEDPRVTARRDTLSQQLSELQAPAILAQEAHTQADGLIGEIDSLIRDRQADRVTERSQSPLNPTGWTRTWSAIKAGVLSIRAEVNAAIANPSRQTAFYDSLPAILVLLAIAVVFVLRGSVWFSRLSGLVLARTRRGQGVLQFVFSLGQVVFPYLGLLAFSVALQTTGMTGRRLGTIVESLPALGLFPILAHWLAGQLLPNTSDAEDNPLALPVDAVARAHRRFVTLGYVLMAAGLVQGFVTVNAFDAVPAAVALFPFGLALVWTLFWLGHLLRRTIDETEEDAPHSFRVALRAILSRGLMAAAVLGLFFAALGYSNAFEVISYPAAMTLYVLGALLLLQRLTVDAYSLISKSENGAKDALIPVLIGFALVLVSVPVLAVIWGAQVTDITELWTRFREGFSIGETTISPTNFLLFAVVFIVGYTVTRLVQGALRTTVLPRTKMDAGGQNAIVSGMGYLGIFLAAVIAITTAGIDLSGLAIIAGALSVGIGFGLQNIVSNFISGIILLIERPISQGDWIEVGGQMGYVRDISVRSTRIETFDRTDVIVPNADLISNQVTNWTRGNNVGRVIVPVGVAYGTDTDWVAGILQNIAEAHPMVLLNPAPSVVFQGFGADSLDFEIRAILRDVNYVLSVKSELNHAIAKRFGEEGIEIPFAQRDLWLRNPETLNFGPQKPARKPARTAPKPEPKT